VARRIEQQCAARSGSAIIRSCPFDLVQQTAEQRGDRS
jgi:hypothetical protein